MPKPDDERPAPPIERGALLWCMRVWVAGLQQGNPASARIQAMMTRLDAADAAPFFEGFMFALRHGATRTLAVDCVCRPRVSADERTLLDAFGLAQERRSFEALLLLRGLLTQAGARAALRSAEAVGLAFARAGRFLPAPAADTGRFALR